MKKGDVVKLKSGGPEMTVNDVNEFMKHPGRQMALCQWFDSKDKINTEFFDPAQLEVVKVDAD